MLALPALLALGGCLAAPAPELRTGEPSGGQVAPRLTMGPATALPVADPLHQRGPAAAHGQDYLLIWQEGFNGLDGSSDILGLRIGDGGAALDRQPIRVCVAAGVQECPAVAFCAGRFLAVWADLRNGTDYDLYAAWVSPAGEVTPKDGFLLAGGAGAQTHPAVAANGKDQFLVVWQGFSEDHFGIFAARVSAASGEVLDKGGFPVMARGERPDAAWNGTNYLVCQKWYAAVVDPDGTVAVPTAQLWNSKVSGWSAAAAAWGRAFVFFNTEPFPDPWGWGGNGAVIGVSLTPDGKSPERGWASELRNLQAAEADHRVKNALDAARWRTHPGWPMGMRGGLKGTQDDMWPSGQTAAAYDGRSLLCVWSRAHLVDNRRLANRDLYLTRVLPDWGLVDRPAVRLVAGATEEANPMLCAGPAGQALLAYERVAPEGVAVEYRLLDEAEDREPPRVEYVVPRSETELIVAFDEPVEAAGASAAGNFRIEGLAVKAAAFNPDARGLQREAILTTDPPVPGRSYVLRVTGVRDRSPAANAAAGGPVEFVAKPGAMQRGDFIERWAVLGPFPREVRKHPAAPETLRAAAGGRVDGVEWAEAKGAVVDFGERYGEKPELMVYAAAWAFSDQPREALLRLDTNDHNRAWLNGRLVHDGISQAAASRGFHDYADRIPVALQKGWNRLLVQVENRAGAWLLASQVTDSRDVPLRDLTWQIWDPEGNPGAAPEK
jgi:hypothetical protein